MLIELLYAKCLYIVIYIYITILYYEMCVEKETKTGGGEKKTARSCGSVERTDGMWCLRARGKSH